MNAWSVPLSSHAAHLLSLLAMLTLVGSTPDTCTGSPTNATASTKVGVSLVQGVSLNRRVDAARVQESLLEQGARKGQMDLDLGVRDVDSDVTGPRGQRDLDMMYGRAHDTGQHVMAASDDVVAPTPGRPLVPSVVAPLVVEKSHHSNDKSDSDSNKSSEEAAADIWKVLRKLQKQLEKLTSRAPLLLQEGSQAVNGSVQNGLTLSEAPVRPSRVGTVILVTFLLTLLACICWKVTRPEPANQSKFAPWNHSPTSVPRLSHVSRSPASMSLPVGEPRHLSPQGTYTNVPGGAIPSSSEDEENHGGRSGDGDGFCPDLVVPQQCECILVVPVYAPVGTFSICDMNGRAVLQAFTQMQGQGLLWQLHLQTATGESLARCIEVRSGTATLGKEFHVLDGKGKHFATLTQVQGQQRFELTTQSGFKLHFYGNFQTQAVNVTDEDESLLATTEPCGTDFDQTGIYYRLRVAPLANVGHSLCALLCIGQILRPKM